MTINSRLSFTETVEIGSTNYEESNHARVLHRTGVRGGSRARRGRLGLRPGVRTARVSRLGQLFGKRWRFYPEQVASLTQVTSGSECDRHEVGIV